MSNKPSGFKQLERFLGMILLFNIVFFLFFLLFSGIGLAVMKIICALFIFPISIFGLWLLHKTKEALRPRGLWLTCSFASLALLTLVSLICRYPGP